MVDRSLIQLEAGMILVHLKTGQFWKITKVSAPVARRNSGGHTNKKSRFYSIVNIQDEKLTKYLNRGDLLNIFRTLETPSEQVLYGK